MAISTETIGRYNNEQVLSALEKEAQRQKALEEAAKSYNVTVGMLTKTYAALEREAKAAAAAQKPNQYALMAAALEESTKATGAQTAAMGNLRSQLIDIGVGLQGGQNPLTILSQQGPQVAEALMSANGALATALGTMSGAAVVGGSLLLVLAPLAAGFYDVERAAADAAETLRLQNDIWAGQIPILEKVRDAQDKAIDVLGLRSQAESDDIEIEKRWAATQEQTLTVLQAKQAVLQASLHMIDDTAAATALANVPEKERAAILDEGNATLRDRRQRLADVEQGLRELDGAVQQGIDADKAAAEYKRALNEEAEREREASRRSAEAKRAEAEAQRALNAEMARVKAINDARERDQQTLIQTRVEFQKLLAAAEKKAATDEEQIAIAARASEAQLTQAANELKVLTANADKKRQIEAELYLGIHAIRQTEADAYAALEEQKTKKAKDEAEKRAAAERRLMEQQIGAVADMVGGVGDLFQTLSERNADMAEKGNVEAQKTAVRQFYIAQFGAIAQATMNTILSASSAAAQAPPGFKLVAAGAATALGASQVAAIAAQPPPTFTDTMEGGYRMREGSTTVQGQENDTAILFRDPIEGILQAVNAATRRQAPTSTPAPARRASLGRQLAGRPVPNLLTDDVYRLTRGRRR